MIKKHFSFLLISLSLLLLFYNPNAAQNYNEVSDKIVRSALTDQRGYNWLKDLCEIGPRLSGSENSMKAIHWAKKKMEDAGFDSVWLQPVMVPKWERGNVEEAIIIKSEKHNRQKLTVTALGGSISTPGKGITAKVIEVKSLDEANQLGENAKGKIIFYNRSFDNGLVATFGGYGNAVDQRSQGAVTAAKVGAVAVLVRSVQSGYDDVPHTGVLSYENGTKKIPAAAISVVDADLLSIAIKEDPNLELLLKLDCKTLPDVKSYNVIGQLTGWQKPKEIIVVGGHFDSWDKGCGAHDDGAPCIQTMEVLDLLKRNVIKPKRTIRCVLFINEENGLRGAIEYGKFAGESSDRHLAAIESDRGAFTPRGFNVTTDSVTLKKLQSWVSFLDKAKIEWIRAGGSGGDVAEIKNTKALFGYIPDDQRYMDLHHSDNDTFDKVHPREMELGSAAMAILVYLLSEVGI